MVKPLNSWNDVPGYLEERDLTKRLREAVQWCKSDTGLTASSDREMGAPERMLMETCLTKNYLVAKGQDYFGKRDLIYLDMRGQDEIDCMYTKEYKPAAENE